MTKKFYLLAGKPDDCTFIGLRSYTAAEARQALDWNRKGGFTEGRIAIYDPTRDLFVDTTTGEDLRPTNKIFKAEPWDAFMAEVRKCKH